MSHYKKKTIPKSLRIKVWENQFGKKYEGNCFACGKKIDVNNWHCAHIVAESKGGKTIESNLRATCQQCNLSSGTRNLKEYSKSFHHPLSCVIL